MIKDQQTDLAQQRRQQAMDLAKQEVLGDQLNLGKKISIPQDLMMEELKLLSNRGSLMFHERLKRAEKYTLEQAAVLSRGANQQHLGVNQTYGSHIEGSEDQQSGEKNIHNEFFKGNPGHKLVSTLKKTVSKKGSPNILAPGYSGPLKDIPYEKFNVTIIPKCYYSPWRQELSQSEQLLTTLNSQLQEVPPKLIPANYKCFNRAPIPFGGTSGSMKSLPLPGFEAQIEPNLTWERISTRPNFNRVPQGWGNTQPAVTIDL